MELTTLLLVIPIFGVLYQGVGMLMDARAAQKWKVAAHPTQARSGKALQEFINFSAKLGFNKTLLRMSRLKDRLDILLLRSGNPFGWKAEDFLLCKEVTAVVFVGVFIYGGADSVLFGIIALALGFWLPDIYMQAKGSARMASIQRLLPGFIDLTALTLESGLDLMAAVERILDKMPTNGLKDELMKLLQENRLGTPRKAALENLAYRVNLADIQSLTSIIIQSEELGTSLATVLRNYAEDMRNRRVLRAEESAGKMPVKLLFPMMVFFFPIVFVIIFGPLAMNFVNGYK